MRYIAYFLVLLLAVSCGDKEAKKEDKKAETTSTDQGDYADVDPGKYATFRLTTDMDVLSKKQQDMIGLFMKAARHMDSCFQDEAWPEALRMDISGFSGDQKAFLKVNYGPWDRLENNKPFIKGVPAKPSGANYYPLDMTKDEFMAWDNPDKTSLYTMIRRDDKGALTAIPYHVYYAHHHTAAAGYLKEAAELAEDPGLKKYLTLRAKALLDGSYNDSDRAWLDMRNNDIDIVIGPIENYEDQLFSHKSAHEAYVLVKDQVWSKKLARYSAMLPGLQKGIPVDDKYKQDPVGRDGQLYAYDVLFYAGDCNAGSKTIAINLPNDEGIQQEKGTRRLQLKNAMRAKFDKILIPIADLLIAEDQRKHITFDAFFANTMFHEVAHGLGIKNTIDGKGTVREALLEQASALEEGKADILGLYMITELKKQNELDSDAELMDYYTTFMAGIFRSVRFGGASAHGRANLLRFNYFNEMNAFTRDEATGRYSVNFDNMQKAMTALSRDILTLQGDGDYEGVKKLMQQKGGMPAQLKDDLARCDATGIPTDIVFEQ
ncbi:MAG: Zn-dependent hydrolase [Bacteroidia bacterium]